MIAKLSEMELENRTKEVAAVIFREALTMNQDMKGVGLGKMVTPESSRDKFDEVITELAVDDFIDGNIEKQDGHNAFSLLPPKLHAPT